MNNHIHLTCLAGRQVWQALESFTPTQNQASFMKLTARQFLHSLLEDDKELHASFKVNKYDRDYHVLKREPLSIELLNKKMFIQTGFTNTVLTANIFGTFTVIKLFENTCYLRRTECAFFHVFTVLKLNILSTFKLYYFRGSYPKRGFILPLVWRPGGVRGFEI